jgi:antitoxin ParD1/3/4
MSESGTPNEPRLPASMAREEAMERWLREEVVPAYHRLRADPASGLSVDDLRAALAQHRQQPL